MFSLEIFLWGSVDKASVIKCIYSASRLKAEVIDGYEVIITV